MNKNTIGFTTTVPMEIIFAGGFTPCDLNNVFIDDERPERFILRAETDGFPKSMCNWIKGLYGVIMENSVSTVITVMEGDCSNTQALSEILRYRGIRTIPFSFPYDRDREVLAREISKLKNELRVTEDNLRRVELEITEARRPLLKIDELTWKDGLVSGAENHLWLVRASDMLGDYTSYRKDAETFTAEALKRQSMKGVRLGCIGVPPIFSDFHDFIESVGGRVVFNETQRQFSMPFTTHDVVDRYLNYTYPYGIFARLEDIRKEIERREIQGIIHYVQAFCYRAIEDVILREVLRVPIVSIEGDLPRRLDTRTRMRIEAFIEMLS
ncbi:MAG TPA: 2-hydroxyacyl-CoA dehydratase [Syntrophorhabdaceae bacterium]|nr:2-hydroxyacyl-CoA dehydratase [Syntrophorhabdaceae bacterium]